MIKHKFSRRIWTVEEKQIMKDLFPHVLTADVCRKLNRTYSSVCGEASLLELHKSEAFRKSEFSGRLSSIVKSGVAYRYPKGHVPANKGEKMPSETYALCKPTMFKKGNQPHNANYDGHERFSKDGYMEIRIRPGKYVLKHRHIWAQSNGIIPKEMLVAFKDRNHLNITIENLELITRIENMQRNTIHRYPVELKSTIRLVNKLKRTINEKQN